MNKPSVLIWDKPIGTTTIGKYYEGHKLEIETEITNMCKKYYYAVPMPPFIYDELVFKIIMNKQTDANEPEMKIEPVWDVNVEQPPPVHAPETKMEQHHKEQKKHMEQLQKEYEKQKEQKPTVQAIFPQANYVPMQGGSNQNYKHLYNKYKLKYLQLKKI